jgi:hypothetical protein
MSSTTHKLPFVRYTRQVATDPMALLSTNVAAATAAQLLQAAPWVEQSENSTTFPARAAMLTDGTPTAAFDAYKYCGDYASGNQIAHAGAVAYRFAVPADALTGPTDVTSIALPIYVDRWLVDGIRIAAYLSDSPAPPADWTTIREGDIYDDAVLPMTYTDPEGLRIVIEKNGTTTLTWAGSTASKQYIYVMLTLEDYTTTRGFWIEGAALIQGSEAVTTFAAAVDADVSDELGYATPIATANWCGAYIQFPSAGQVSPYDDSWGHNVISRLEDDGLATSPFVSDTGLKRSAAFLNQLTLARNGSLIDEAVPTNTPSAGVYLSWKRALAWAITISDLIFPMVAAFHAPSAVRVLKFYDAFPSYPTWLRLRLNVYAQPSSSISVYETGWITSKAAYMVTPDWVRGTYSANSMTNILSMELSPDGYAAADPLPAKGVTLDGLQVFFITVHVDRIVSEPDSSLIPVDDETPGTPFEYPYKTKTIYINN